MLEISIKWLSFIKNIVKMVIEISYLLTFTLGVSNNLCYRSIEYLITNPND